MAIRQAANDQKEVLERVLVGELPYIGSDYTSDYINTVFLTWYRLGKPNPRLFVKSLPNPVESGVSIGYPSESTVRKWIEEIFKDRAAMLDEQVSKQMAERMIAEKVAMLESHAKIASEMQTMAIDWLRQNRDKLNSNSSVRLLVEGVRIERESRGIPRTLEKLTDQTDDELMTQIKDLLLRSPVEFSEEETE